MTGKWLNDQLRLNAVAGVNIEITPAGDIAIDTCTVIYKNGNLALERQQTRLANTNDLRKSINEHQFVALNITGKNVLTKTIPLKDADDVPDHELLSRLIPNSKAEDFYIQRFEGSANVFVSLIRRLEADRWINALTAHGFRIVALSLGPFASSQLLPMLNVYDGPILFNGFRIHLDQDGSWLGYDIDESISAPFPLKIQALEIDEVMVLPFAAAMQVVLKNQVMVMTARVPQADKTLEEVTLRSKLLLKTVIAAGCLFTLLFLNIFLLSYLSSENDQLAVQTEKNVQLSSLTEKQADLLNSEQSMLKALGWRERSKSHLIDDLAALVPAELTWQLMAVNPLDEAAFRRDRKEQILENTIIIKGQSESVIPVNEYLARIRTIGWVKKSRLIDYSFDQEQNKGTFQIFIAY